MGYNLESGTRVLGARSALYLLLGSGYICTNSLDYTFKTYELY